MNSKGAEGNAIQLPRVFQDDVQSQGSNEELVLLSSGNIGTLDIDEHDEEDMGVGGAGNLHH
jgi:hypothetical protein